MEVTINIPEKISDIKLYYYQKFLQDTKGMEDQDKVQQKMVQYLCGLDLGELISIDATDAIKLGESISKLFVDEQPLIERFSIGKTEFGFIPNLENITFGEYVDLESYIVDWDNMHKAMAVLYRPIVKKQRNWLRKKEVQYEIETYTAEITYEEVMKHIPLNIALGALFFFTNLRIELLNSLMDYLEKDPQMRIIHHKLSLEKGGDGIVQYMPLVKEMLQKSRI